jgi:hypothetical protein
MTATEASRGFSAVLDYVHQKQEPVRVLRDNREAAVITPPRNAYSVARFLESRRKRHHFDDPGFLQDILDATTSLTPPEDPWAEN